MLWKLVRTITLTLLVQASSALGLANEMCDNKPLALIVGVGDGLSASLARLLHSKGYRLALASRSPSKFADLAHETEASSYSCDSSKIEDVEHLFSQIQEPLSVVIYNPSQRVRGAIQDLDPTAVKNAMDVTAFGSFLVGQKAAANMIQNERGGTIIFTGASAGVKGFPYSATFAMGKFAQRGLAESMARELHPQNIHVCWVNIDGPIRNPGRTEPPENPDSMLDPNAIAQTYWSIIQQDRSAWTNEIAVRPWVEKW